MARKKRSVVTTTAPVIESKDKRPYQDSFQHDFGKKVEDVGKKFEGHGKNILYGLAAALVVLGIIVWISLWNSRSNAAARAALGRAIETSQANVSEVPAQAGSSTKTFKTRKERSEAAIAEFQAVADKYRGDVKEKAKYFIAVNRLVIDRPAAILELEAISDSNDEVGKLAKFALAQTRVDDGRPDEAASLYRELAAMNDSLIAKDTINFELAKIYEKQGKKQEAVDLLFGIVKPASEAKDLEGSPVPPTSTARSAKEKLQELDPEKAKEIPEPAPGMPPAGFPGGM